MDDQIRKKAEDLLRERQQPEDLIGDTDLPAILHELRVHQIELELQNQELIEAQVALRTSQQQYFRLFQFAPVGYFTVTHAGVILEVNVKGTEMLGKPRQQIINTPMITAIDPNYHETWFSHLESVFSSPHQHSDELVLRNRSKERRYVQIESKMMDHPHNDRCLITLTDITWRKEAEERELEAAVERERSKILTLFIRDAAHEFRTPLTIIQSGLYFVMQIIEDQALRDSIDEIGIAVKDITRLLDSMLDVVRLNSYGSIRADYADPHMLFERTLVDLAETIREQRHDVQLNIDPNIESLYCDQAVLYRGIIEVVRNAVIYTPENGKIMIRVRKLGDFVRIDVQDNGMGIAPHHTDRVFDYFYQIDKAKTLRGFGLGLAIARRAVQLHNGRIDLTSRPEEGTTVTLIIPATPQKKEPER